MAGQLIRGPAEEWAAGERAVVTVPVTLPDDVTLADFGTFELVVWEDPGYPRAGTPASPPDPVAGGWGEAVVFDGTAGDGVVEFVGTMPAAAGVRRYAFAAWGLGGTAGDACLVYPMWLTLVPGRG